MTESSEPIHPGKILYEQAMQPLGVSRNKLARDIDVPVGRISDIVAGKRGVTPDTALRLGKYFGTSAEMWMRFQSDYDLFVARNSEWPNIAPRVRELQPIDPDAVAPVTAMDEHAETAPADDAELRPDVRHADDTPSEAPSDPPVESDDKWWSASLSGTAGDPSSGEIAPDTESPDPSLAASDVLEKTDALEASADDVDLLAEQPPAQRTITLDVRPNGGSDETAEAGPADLAAPEHDASITEQTFEINIHPAAADGGEPTDETDRSVGRRRFTVDVVREATQALEPLIDAPSESEDPGPATLESEPLDEDGLTIEFDEDDLARELPGDAFAEEEVEERKHEYYEPIIARTGTDDFGPLDPPLSGPGLDVAGSTSTVGSADSEPRLEAPTGIGSLTPANWSIALESARRDEPDIKNPATPGPASSDGGAAPATVDHFDVPLPSEFVPAMEGSMPPRSPAETDDPHVSLDIPDPEEARKLYEYDD